MGGEFYAEGVLKRYSFLDKVVVYLRKVNRICRVDERFWN